MMSSGWWETLTGVPTDSSARAFVTTLHFALLVLRQHRPRGNTFFVLLPALLFVAFPWILATPLWLAVVLAAHVIWFVACERLIPESAPPAKAKTAAPMSGNAPKAAEVSASAPPRASSGFQQLSVLAVFQETPEIRTFRMARPPGFVFRPGQFLMVKAEVEGKPLVRCYSITSTPSTSGYLEISIRKQGRVSAHLHETLRPGSKVEARGPGGTFVYPEGTRPIALIAGGIGITPLLSMLRHALEQEPLRPVTLLLSARTEGQIPFHQDLRLLAHRHPNFRLVIALTGGSPSNGYHSGRIDKGLLTRVIADPSAPVYLLCGPLPMIEETRAMLQSLGVADRDVHFEKFEVAAATAQAGAEAQEIKVSLKATGRDLKVRENESILEAADSAGVELPSMCRAGVCGTCVVTLLQGEVDGDFGVLDDEERELGRILLCVARPLSDCVIDA